MIYQRLQVLKAEVDLQTDPCWLKLDKDAALSRPGKR